MKLEENNTSSRNNEGKTLIGNEMFQIRFIQRFATLTHCDKETRKYSRYVDNGDIKYLNTTRKRNK